MSSSHDDDYAMVVGDYKPGSITRVQLKNFLTYTMVDFKPGPRLNMVIGANGTGKSSILCALCLGLGGEPKLLGRADDARSFIMHEKNLAVVEITLAPFPGEPVHTLRRVIDREKGSERGNGRGASTFYINGKKVNIKDVQQLVKGTYKISIDNLCTFLPQDKVGSFSGFNQQDLLQETEKTLTGSQHVYQQHMDLIEAEKSLSSGDHNVDTIKEKLDKLLTEKKRFEREKERMEEREEALRQVDLLQKRAMWVEFQNLREEVVQLKEEKAAAKSVLKEKAAEILPLEEEEERIIQRKQEVEAKHKKLEQQLKRNREEMEKYVKKHDNYDDAIEGLIIDMNQIDSDRNRKVEVYEKAKERVAGLEEDFQGLQTTQEKVDSDFAEASNEKKQAHRALTTARNDCSRLQHEFASWEDKANQTSRKLSDLQDEKAQRRQMVTNQNPSLGKIMKWLDGNRKMFRHNVWGPIACEVSMKSKSSSAFLEGHLPRNLLGGFVVEDKDDYDLLYNEVRNKQKLPINVYLVKNGRLQDVKRQYGEEKYEKLKSDYGVLGYLDESFTCSDAVMQALRTFGSVHKVLVGNEATQRSLDDKGLLDFLSAPDPSLDQRGQQGSCIFASVGNTTKKYTQIVSRYSGAVSSRIDDIQPARMLAPGVDPAVKARLEAQLKSIHESMNEIRPKLADADKTKANLEQEGQRISAHFVKAKETQAMFHKMKSKLNNAISKLEDAEKDLENDDQSKKTELTKSIMLRVADSITAIESHANSHEKLMKATYSSAGVRISKDAVHHQHRAITDTLLDRRQAIQEIQKKFDKLSKEFSKKKEELKTLQISCNEKAQLQDEHGEDLPLKAELDELPDTLEEIGAAIEEAQQKVDAIHHDPNAIRQYKANLSEIEKVEGQLAKVQGSKEAIESQIQQLLAPWKQTLENAVSGINKLFENYMKEVGCTGEVRLRKGGESGNEDEDYKNWGVEIRVSFREGVKAQTLSAQVQSGGERSVSTIMYLMALQNMMVAPFRCVDEINQGLDERNERLVFRRIVNNSCGPPKNGDPTDHCGQYFLITPKLLPQLTDMEHQAVTVLLVMNGPHNFDSPTDFNIDELVRKRRRNMAADDVDEDEENRPNAPAKRIGKKKRRSN